jgi:5'(3')-deoxyribonucleotidase
MNEKLCIAVEFRSIVLIEDSFAEEYNKISPKKLQTDKLFHCNLFDNIPKKKLSESKQIISKAGFFRNLMPAPVNDMNSMNFDVMILITNTYGNNNAIIEQLEWINYHLGEAWRDKIIITPDKTIFRSHILIDVTPQQEKQEMFFLSKKYTNTRINEPSWKLVLYSKSYNQKYQQTLPTITSWYAWKQPMIKAIPDFKLIIDPLLTEKNFKMFS